MILVMLRHAPAEKDNGEIDDHNRRLTDVGIKKMKKAAAGLAVMLAKENDFFICSSPKTRTMETTEIVAEYFPNAGISNDVRLETGDNEELIKLIDDNSDHNVLILSGHEPWLSNFSYFLCQQELHFKKGAAAALLLEEGWQANGGKLLWFMQPRALRRLSLARDELLQKKDNEVEE